MGRGEGKWGPKGGNDGVGGGKWGVRRAMMGRGGWWGPGLYVGKWGPGGTNGFQEGNGAVCGGRWGLKGRCCVPCWGTSGSGRSAGPSGGLLWPQPPVPPPRTMAAVGFEDFSAPPGSELALPPLFGGHILEGELEAEVEFEAGGGPGGPGGGGEEEDEEEEQRREEGRRREEMARRKMAALGRRCRELEQVWPRPMQQATPPSLGHRDVATPPDSSSTPFVTLVWVPTPLGPAPSAWTPTVIGPSR